MDTASRVLARYAARLKYEDLSPEVVRYSKHLLLDTIGVALGGYLSDPSYAARLTAREIGGIPESTVIGTGEKTSCSLAALVNDVMVRYLDFMDIYYTMDACHPSENIPAALAVGERQCSSGRDVLMAIFLGFEFQGRLADTWPAAKLGWHHVSMGGYVVPYVAGKLLGLNEDQMVNAAGIGGFTNNTLNYAIGHITMVKAVGYGLASQRGIDAALMAKNGMTGPDDPIERFNKIAGGNVDLGPVIKGGDKPRILKSGIKPYAAEYMTHTPLDALRLIVKENNLKPDDVDSMHLRMFEFAMQLAAPDRYKPDTREQADHSLPYCLAVGLLEGDLGPEQFKHDQWKDPKVLDLMSRIKVTMDPELEKVYPNGRPADLEVTTKDGKTYRKRVDFPKGDEKNPMTDEEVQAKFKKLAGPLMSEWRMQRIIDTVNNIEDVDDIHKLMELLVV
jgi:2-methylcitrate dehydratase